jgi:hypothetical protein
MPQTLTLRRKKARRGALTLEWILIITVLVIGVIGGMSMVRTAVVQQMHDMANSIIQLQVTSQAELDAGSGIQGNTAIDNNNNFLNSLNNQNNGGTPNNFLGPADPNLGY